MRTPALPLTCCRTAGLTRKYTDLNEKPLQEISNLFYSFTRLYYGNHYVLIRFNCTLAKHQ